MLEDLNALGRKLDSDFKIQFSHKDVELPTSFKKSYEDLLSSNSSLGYKGVNYHRYSTEVTTSTSKTISMPNYWFVAAHHFSPYVKELLKYKNIVKGVNLPQDWPKALKNTSSFPFTKNEYPVTDQLNDEEFVFFTKFILDYDWWWGAKTVDRGDFYVSPILKLGNFLAESQTAIAELAWQISQIKNPDFESEMVSINQEMIKLEPLEINSFISAVNLSHLYLKDSLVYRFVSSLETKPFTILTGLSGSGKTKLAEAFSFWITNGFSASKVFTKGERIDAARATYLIEDIDTLGVLLQSEGSTKAFLPFKLIHIWVKVINENNFDAETGSQEIQKKVIERGIEGFSPTMNSFHSQLRALAFKYIESTKQQYESAFNNQICMIAVGADWTNREPLLGFPNALESNQYVKPDSGVLDVIIAASKDPVKPYFLILDEMNMSHVERYFADFLSAMESTDGVISLHSGTEDWNGVPPTITLPKNLFIIGTVNIDETTYMFSPKVLDRANVIEFRVLNSDMKSFFKAPKGLNMDSLRGAGAAMGESFVAKALETGLVDNDLGDALMPFFTMLQKAGAEFGYRTAVEMSRFVAICSELADDKMGKDDVIDAAIIQKLLPKLHGSRNKIESILKELGNLCLVDSSLDTFGEKIIESDIKYSLSYEKLMRMHDRVLADGFTSFAEA